MRGIPTDEERVSDIKKLLTCGTFYFAWAAPDQGSPIDLVSGHSLMTSHKFGDFQTPVVPTLQIVLTRGAQK